MAFILMLDWNLKNGALRHMLGESDIPQTYPVFERHGRLQGRQLQLRALFSWICCQGPLNEDFSARRYLCFP